MVGMTEAKREVQTIEPVSTIDAAARPEPLLRASAARVGWQNRYVVALCLADTLVGLLAASAALVLRFGSYGLGLYLRDYLLLTLAMPVAWVASLGINRAYEARHLFVGTDEYTRVFRSGIGLTAGLAIVSFAFDLRLARGYVIIALPLATLLGVVTRFVLRQRLHRSWAAGIQLHRVILVGHERAVADMTRRLRDERHHGMGVIGACLPGGIDTNTFATGLPPVYGSFNDVAKAVSRSDADTVVVLACPEIDGAALRRIAWQLERDEVDLIVASTLVDVAGDRIAIRPVDGLPMLHVEHPRLKGSGRAFKGLFDRAGALALLTVASPVLAAIALLVRFAPGSSGPAVFRQERIGKDGEPFTLYKFRTMHVNAEARLAELRTLNEHDGGLFKMRHDPRVTTLGHWLRRFSIDEVPQLFNVLKGDMSLVGPRPPLASEVAGYPADMRRRLVVKPGLTGLWQVSGRSDLSWEESIRLDIAYVENWSLAMDLAILGRTVTAVIRSSGAY